MLLNMTLKGERKFNLAISYVTSSGEAKLVGPGQCALGQEGNDPNPTHLRTRFLGFGHASTQLLLQACSSQSHGILDPHMMVSKQEILP